MIERYCTDLMSGIWSELNKFTSWLRVEKAILRAMVSLGQMPEQDFKTIMAKAGVIEETVERIEEIDKEIHHDFLAFVQAIQEQLPEDVQKYFHLHPTSYDIEEPALSLLTKNSLRVILIELGVLLERIFEKARIYRNIVRIERTHGQHAEPNTLGLVFLCWYDQLQRQTDSLTEAIHIISETKISGAVGTYAGGLSPELEQKALEHLGLKPAIISGQIILRDRHAQIICTLAVLAGVLENIALNIRLLGQTEICELQEPFGKKQKGSSRMPHKQNTILTENLCGLARIVRANAGIALENIPTWGARDISHSSTERVIFADSFQLVHFMIKRLTEVIEGLVIYEDRIKENLEMTAGIIFSPEVKEFLMAEGFSPKDAYRISQESAFKAHEKNVHFSAVVRQHPKISYPLYEKMKKNKIFDVRRKLEHVNDIYERFNL